MCVCVCVCARRALSARLCSNSEYCNSSERERYCTAEKGQMKAEPVFFKGDPREEAKKKIPPKNG